MTFSDLIGQWKSIAQFARDLGVDYELAKKWKQRNFIPSIHWPAIVEAAKQRDIDVTIVRLSEMEQNRAA